MDKRAKGREYERLAAKFYREQGFEIIEENWQAGHKEIDLIVRKGAQLVFVEVKGSATPAFGHPANRVDEKKRLRLVNAATQYLIAKNISDVDLRFDVIAVVNGVVEHFPDAFGADPG